MECDNSSLLRLVFAETQSKKILSQPVRVSIGTDSMEEWGGAIAPSQNLWGRRHYFRPHRASDKTYEKGSPYSITEHRVPEAIPALGSQPAGDVNHKPDGRLPLLSARPAVTPATLKRAATNFAAW